MISRIFVQTVFCFIAFATTNAHATILRFSFTDPAGDQQGRVDVTGLQFTFEKASGAYSIDIFASPTNPFNGSFRINVNLFNPDTGTRAVNPSFFASAGNDISLTSPTTKHTLTGINSRLLAWDAGDRVAIGNASLGNPDGGITAFGSSVSDLPFVSGALARDIIGTASNNNGAATQIAIIQTVPPSVPEPSTLLTFCGFCAIGAVVLSRGRYRKKEVFG